MEKAKWIWMPCAGHFICGEKCEFHLTTYVGKYIVSTIGNYWPDSAVRKINAEFRKKKIDGIGDAWDFNYFKEFGYEDLGLGRKYETMVFKAKKQKDDLCCPYRMSSPTNLDMRGYNDPADAFKGHMKMCLKWSKK